MLLKQKTIVLVASKSSATAASASIIELDIFGFALCLFLHQEIFKWRFRSMKIDLSNCLYRINVLNYSFCIDLARKEYSKERKQKQLKTRHISLSLRQKPLCGLKFFCCCMCCWHDKRRTTRTISQKQRRRRKKKQED